MLWHGAGSQQHGWVSQSAGAAIWQYRKQQLRSGLGSHVCSSVHAMAAHTTSILKPTLGALAVIHEALESR